MSGSEGPLVRRFEAQVQARGSVLAVQCGTQQLSYRTLDSLVEANRRALLAQGRGPGHRLGWLGENSVAMLAALLACARLGVVLVPLDAGLDTAALRRWVQQAGLHGVLATPDASAQAAPLRADCLAHRPPDEPLGDRDLLLATAPEGAGPVLYGQAALLAAAELAITAQALTPDDRLLVALPMADPDALCGQVLPALMSGAALLLHSRFEAGAWLADAAGWRATTGLLPLKALRALVQHAHWAATDLSALRVLVCCGGVLPHELAAVFAKRGVRLQCLDPAPRLAALPPSPPGGPPASA